MVPGWGLIKIGEVLQEGALKELDGGAARGDSEAPATVESTPAMSQFTLLSPTFFLFLEAIDRAHAQAIRLLGCGCGGPLHQGHFQRKPRWGGARASGAVDTTRFSFCCGACRQRTMPASVRFLGRRVYWGATVVLATALCAGLSLRRGRQLSELFDVPALTILRWRQWWLNDFAASPLWQSLRGGFLPPVVAGDLPSELLRRAKPGDEHGAMVTVLQWIAPLSTLTEGR